MEVCGVNGDGEKNIRQGFVLEMFQHENYSTFIPECQIENQKSLNAFYYSFFEIICVVVVGARVRGGKVRADDGGEDER
jgi:hypothetical protein